MMRIIRLKREINDKLRRKISSKIMNLMCPPSNSLCNRLKAKPKWRQPSSRIQRMIEYKD